MDEHDRSLVSMRAVVVSREYGSGGGEIAARLSRQLGWRLIDHELVAQVALRLQVPEEEAREHDEHAEGASWRAFDLLQGVQPPWVALPAVAPGLSEGAYQVAVRHIVEDAVDAGRAVIVGRGGQMILADRRDVLRVRVVASLEHRVAYVARREQLGESDARDRIEHVERDRARYLRACYHRGSDDRYLYDLVVNTGDLDLDSGVQIVALALERKAAGLALPPEEVGQAAGMPPYPAPPGRSLRRR